MKTKQTASKKDCIMFRNHLQMEKPCDLYVTLMDTYLHIVNEHTD